MLIALLLTCLFDFHKDCNAPPNPLFVNLQQCASYEGFDGYMFWGTNVPPQWLTDKQTAALAQVTPRDDAGAPDANGSTVVATIGQAYSVALFNYAAQFANADTNKSPHVHFVNGAWGAGASVMADPNSPYWIDVDNAIAGAGFTNAQVQVLWLMTTNFFPTDPFPQHAIALEQDILSIVANVHARYPNLAMIYLSPRMSSRYADVSGPPPYLCAPPYDFENGFADQWAIRDQDPLNPVCVTWGPCWFDESVPCSDFGADGTHLSPTGAAKWGKILWRSWRFLGWYLGM